MTNLRESFISLIALTVKMLCAPKFRAFKANLREPAIQQEKLLQELLLDVSRTEYGKSFEIDGSETYKQFSDKLPIVDYEKIEALISRQIETQESLLTPHKVVHIEPTSGSSGASKKIPYTHKLLHSFSSMFCIWAYDLLNNSLKLKTGKIFLSISPTLNSNSFNDDSNYLDGALKCLIEPFIVKPHGQLTSENYRQKLAETILSQEDLEVISIWSPSYLLSIIEYITNHRSELSRQLSAERALLIQNDNIDWIRLFPCLQLISCWDSAHAASYIPMLKKYFPGVQIQGKGLLATEAAITIPLSGIENCVPLIDDVFLEFEDDAGKTYLLHETIKGQTYQLIISQKAGLTRYRLNDLVMVCAPIAQTPTLKFIGKANIVCDLVGEKLAENFVRDVMSNLPNVSDYILVPFASIDDMKPARYLMLTGSTHDVQASLVDGALGTGFHYRQARELGQLDSIEIIQVDNLNSKLLEFFQSEGMKIGDIKNMALIADTEKASRLLHALNLPTAERTAQRHEYSRV